MCSRKMCQKRFAGERGRSPILRRKPITSWLETLEQRQMFTAAVEAGVWQIRGEATDDIITVEAVTGDATTLQATINGQVAGTASLGDLTDIRIEAGAGNDHVTLRLDSTVVSLGIYVAGGDGNDRLFGSSLAEVFTGGAGNDRIDGGGGNDILNGDAGNDNLSGGDGDDQFLAAEGNDTVAGGWGADQVDGGIGKDLIRGGYGADELRGDKGPDSLYGGPGADAIDGGKGRNRVYAETGIDTVGSIGAGTPGVKVGKNTLATDDTQDPTPRQTTDAELKQWVVDAAVDQWKWAFGKPADPWIYYWGRGGEISVTAGRTGGDGVVVPPSAPPVAAPTTGNETGEKSDTNTQEAGVDEADLVETDGTYIYSLESNELIIAKAVPAGTMSVVGRWDINNEALGIYLTGNRLTILTGTSRFWAHSDVIPAIGQSIAPVPMPDPSATVTVLDVSNPAAPSLVETTKLDGAYKSSRMIGDQLYVVMNNDAWIPEPQKIPNPDPDPDPDPDPIDGPPVPVPVGAPGDRIAPPVPSYSDKIYESEATYRARLEGMTLEQLLPGYESTAGGQSKSGSLVTTPHAYVRDLADDSVGQNLTTIALLNVGDSKAGLATTSTVAGYGGEVYASGDSIYLAGADWDLDGVHTRLFKFNLEADAIPLQATGEVTGIVPDQFGMDEEGDTFRIATNGWSNDANASHLFVMETVGDKLEVVGSVNNLAKGENLQSARFDGDRAYLVTFRQIDPLFTIDLSDPRKPKVAGELKIPGFSSYLQPIGNGLLLGIGRDIDAVQNNDEGLQISLFDVSNISSPTRLANYTIAGAYSAAESDHHAFAYFSDQQILAIPTTDFEDNVYTTVLAVLKVDVAGKKFTSLGEVTPPSDVRRAIRIDDVLYAVADDHIQAVQLQQPGTVIATLPTAKS